MGRLLANERDASHILSALVQSILGLGADRVASPSVADGALFRRGQAVDNIGHDRVPIVAH